MREEEPVLSARTRRFLKAKKLPDDILPKELAHTLPTLRAIFRNCSDRSRSIRELAAERNCSPAAAKFKYYADRNSLMEYFSVIAGAVCILARPILAILTGE